MHTCVRAGLHACTPLRMCKQRSTHKHTLTCVRTWRILIIMIDHGKTSGYNRFCSRLYVPACVHAQIHVWMLVCMLVHLCLCVTNHPCMSKCWHACIHEGFWSSWSIMVKTSGYNRFWISGCICTCMCLHMHACMYAGLHACTPLLMCNQPSMHEHMLTCMHTWRVLIIMIDHSETSGYKRFDLRAKRAVITASTSGLMYLHVFTHAYLCACWSACLYTFAYV